MNKKSNWEVVLPLLAQLLSLIHFASTKLKT
jgi:hypothetical protein